METKKDFVMEQNGLCFFCLKRAGSLGQMNRFIKRESNMDPDKPSFPIYSLQCLSRFLKMDIGKVFNDQELIPKHLLTLVENSALKVELCDECAHLMNKFSQLHQNLEKIRIELVSSLSDICDKFLEANGKSMSEELVKLRGEHFLPNSEDVWRGKLDIMDVLRTEAIQKCRGKISWTTPRIKVENLTKSEVTRIKVKLKQNSSSISVITPQSHLANIGQEAGTSGIKMPIGNIKEEYSATNLSYYDEDGMSDYFEDFDMHSNNPTPPSKQNDGESNVAEARDDSDPLSEFELPTRKRKMGKKSTIPTDTYTVTSSRHPTVVKPLFNQRTRKHSCPACRKEFRSVAHFKIHFAGVHEKIQYKCTLCTKSFSQRANYNLHYRIAHKGVRVTCQVCNSVFAYKSSLIRHQSTTCKLRKRASKSVH